MDRASTTWFDAPPSSSTRSSRAPSRRVVGAVEVRGRAAGRVRLHVVPDALARSLTGFVRRTVTSGAVVLTDGWQGYAPLPDLGYHHRPRTQGPPERAGQLLPHIHRVFGKLKTWLGGTHHGVGHDHLQAYLDEFAFRFNRRRAPMAAFQTLLGLASGVHGPTTGQKPLRVFGAISSRERCT